MNDRLTVEDFLRHMLEAGERIRRYTHEITKEQFLRDELIQDAVLRNISIFGEAVSNIRREYPEFVKHTRAFLGSLFTECETASFTIICMLI